MGFNSAITGLKNDVPVNHNNSCYNTVIRSLVLLQGSKLSVTNTDCDTMLAQLFSHTHLYQMHYFSSLSMVTEEVMK
jgi:hypothetical protein